jgi:hypothetical protein
MSSLDAVEELHQLRLSITRQFEQGPAPFWWEMIDLSRHEFQTRVEQHLAGRGHEGEALFWLTVAAMADYNDYWKEQDE